MFARRGAEAKQPAEEQWQGLLASLACLLLRHGPLLLMRAAHACRAKTGYGVRKHFGPHEVHSRAESYADYDNSYHNTADTRRGTLPVAFMAGGGAAMGATSAQGSMHGAGRSNAPSVIAYFEGSVRGGTAAGARLAVSARPLGLLR